MDPPDDKPEFSFPTSRSPPNFGPFSPPSGTAAASSSSTSRPPPPSATAASSSSPDYRLPPLSSSDFRLPTLSSSDFRHPPPSFAGASSSSSYFGFPPPSSSSSSYFDFPPPSFAGASDFGLPPPSYAGATPFPVDFHLPPPYGTGAPSSPVDLRLSPPSGAGSGRTRRKRGRPRLDATGERTFLAGGSVAASSSTILTRSRTRNSNRDGEQGFTPHFIYVDAGEDVYQRLMQFLAGNQNDMYIISASGLIGSVTIRQPPGNLRGTIQIQGEFDIVALCGCYVRGSDEWRTGGFAVSLVGSNGEMTGGRIEGGLMAAGPVQVTVGTFVCEGERNAGLMMELPSPAAYRGGHSDWGGRVRRGGYSDRAGPVRRRATR